MPPTSRRCLVKSLVDDREPQRQSQPLPLLLLPPLQKFRPLRPPRPPKFRPQRPQRPKPAARGQQPSRAQARQPPLRALKPQASPRPLLGASQWVLSQVLPAALKPPRPPPALRATQSVPSLKLQRRPPLRVFGRLNLPRLPRPPVSLLSVQSQNPPRPLTAGQSTPRARRTARRPLRLLALSFRPPPPPLVPLPPLGAIASPALLE